MTICLHNRDCMMGLQKWMYFTKDKPWWSGRTDEPVMLTNNNQIPQTLKMEKTFLVQCS